MVFDVSVAMTWVLFLALFPISYFWLRRAWRIVMNRDFSEVATKRGVPPPNPERFAPYEMAINLIAGLIIVGTIVAIVLGEWDYETWSAVAGSTLWCKLMASFGLSWHAHAKWGKGHETR